MARAAAIASLVRGSAEAWRWRRPRVGSFGLRGEEVVQEGPVNLTRGVGTGEVRETRDLAGGDELLCCPDIVGCGPSQEVGPVGVLGFLNRFEISLPREPGEAY